MSRNFEIADLLKSWPRQDRRDEREHLALYCNINLPVQCAESYAAVITNTTPAMVMYPHVETENMLTIQPVKE